jgi:RNA-directed DNA polymerase
LRGTGLTLHPDKTRFVDFRFKRPGGTRHPDTDGTAFDFLGFTHVWGRSRTGTSVVRQVTAKGRYARALAAVTDWCRRHRHWSIADQHARLSAMMRGHYAYYGITGNHRRLRWYGHQVARVWQKWLSRRDRRGRFLWHRFRAYLERHPLPPARIVRRYAAASEPLS